MIKVTIDRKECTSCSSCWETCPSFFEESPDDSFSQIIEKFRESGKIGEGSVPEDLETCVKEAADLCPVQIITVGDPESA